MKVAAMHMQNPNVQHASMCLTIGKYLVSLVWGGEDEHNEDSLIIGDVTICNIKVISVLRYQFINYICFGILFHVIWDYCCST